MIFIDDFHGNESTINNDIPAKEDNVFDINDNWITVVDDKLKTNVDCSSRTIFQIEYHEGNDALSSTMSIYTSKKFNIG